MIEPLLSLGIVENILAAGYLTGAGVLDRLVRDRLLGFVTSMAHLGPTYQAILARHPNTSQDQAPASRSPFKHSIDSHFHHKRYIGQRYFQSVSDPDYHSWWGWWYYFRGLDTLDEECFKRSALLFEKGSVLRASLTPNDGDLFTPEEHAKLDKLNRLLPLTELTIRFRREGDVYTLRGAFLESAGELLQKERNPESDFEVVACRQLGLIYHRCYTRGIAFSPDNEPTRNYTEDDFLDYMREKGLDLYQKAINGNYNLVLTKLNIDPSYSRLKPSLNALERKSVLPAPEHQSGWLRKSSPRIMVGAFLLVLLLFVAAGLWVFHFIVPSLPQTINGVWDKIQFCLYCGLPPIPMAILAILYIFIVNGILRRFRGSAPVPPSVSTQ